MTTEKFTSDKATIECRYNAVTQKYRCHIAIGRERIGPLYVAVEEAAPDEAARQALTRAVERSLIDADDIETEEGVPVVHAESAKAEAPAAKAKAPDAKSKTEAPATKAKSKTEAPAATEKHTAKVKAEAPAATEKHAAKTATKPKRSTAPMGEEKASAIIGNGKETAALEDLYLETKGDYHAVGEALRERHLAVAAIAAQPE